MPRHARVSLTPTISVDAKRAELARARYLARALAETVPEAARTSFAARFSWAAMRVFAEVKAPGCVLRGSFVCLEGSLDETTLQLAQSIGRTAAILPLEEGGHALTSLYTTLLTSKDRSGLGAFYTPPALIQRLVDLAEEGGVDWRTARVLDPASGGAAFLLAVASRMRLAMTGSESAFILAQLGTRLAGFEVDPHAAGLSQALLEVALWDLASSSGREIPLLIKVCDTLEEPPAETFDLVIGNPPYGRIALTGLQRERFGRSLYGHANLYGVFTDIALRWTRPGGYIAYLTPTSVLGGQYYQALRHLLATEAPPIAIDFVHTRKGVFEDVLQETLLALYQRGGTADRFQVHYLNVENEREARLTKNGKVALPSDPMAPWLAPRSPDHVPLIAASEQLKSRLSDWGYEVSTGPLVWNRFKQQLKTRAVQDTRPLIWAEAVTADGRFVFRAEKRNHAPYFKLEPGDGWLVVNKGCVLLQRTTSKEQQRRLIAAELPETFVESHGGVVVENHLNMVRPLAKPKVSTAVVAAFLNSEIADQLFRCISGSVAVSAFELRSLPLPTAKAMSQIEKLVAAQASSDQIEHALCKLYGLPIQ